MKRRAVVVGGGVAGIAAALRLAEEGSTVTLLERSNRLGGRAGSFEDPDLGERIDNCQHVALGCCDAYLALLERLNHADSLRWTSEFHYIERDGRRSTLPILPLPAPLHGLGLLARARFLPLSSRLAIARAMRRIGAIRSSSSPAGSFADWLVAAQQPQDAVDRFWTPIIVSACNARPERCDASAALMVFRDGFLRSHRAAAMGVPIVPLAELYSDVPRLLAERGGRVETGAHVETIHRREVLLRSGERIEADAVVLAAAPRASAELLGAADLPGAAEIASGLGSLRFSPIVAVHLEYAEAVSELPHAVLLDAEFDWLFFKQGGRRVHAVASAADELVDRPGEQLVAAVTAEIRARFGASAEPVWGRAIKERRATFLIEPGSDALRPAVDELAPHLWLAGDATATGWPATMEGATRSGLAAADAVLRYFAESRPEPELSAKAP